jgi:hypothetical protein
MKNVFQKVLIASMLTVLVACLTMPDSNPPPPVNGVPKAPEQFAAFGSSTSTITLAWSPVKGATGYVLERKVDSMGTFVPFANVGSQVSSLLDQNLSQAITYSYRIQAFNNLGTSPIVEQKATTNTDEALKTQNELPIDQPVQQVINRQGGTVSSIDGQTTAYFSSEGVPDGTQITLQAFANPVENNPRPGLEISSSAPFAKPISVSFKYGEEDVLDAKNLVMALQELDGSWVVRPSTLDEEARTITLTISPDAPPVAGVSAKGTPRGKTKAKVLRLKSTWIVPKSATVEVKKKIELIAYGLFSDYPCDVPGLDNQVFCSMIGLLVNPQEMVRPILREVKKLENYLSGWERIWTVELKIGGGAAVGTIVKNGKFGAIYTAPDNKPSPNPVKVRFTSVKVTGNRYSATPIPADITVIGTNYKVVGDFTSVGYPACSGTVGIADLTDHVEFTLSQTGSNTNLPYLVESIQNQISDNKNFRVSEYAAGGTVTQNSMSEVLNATKGHGEFKGDTNTLSVALEGFSWTGGCTLTYPKLTFNLPAGESIESTASFEFKTNAFINNTQTVKGEDISGFGSWEFTITKL